MDDAASLSHEVAINAVYQLRRKGWLVGENGALKGADLSNAKLQGVDLHEANLQGTSLAWADLRDANLWGANLGKSLLQEANLQGSNLLSANLQKADLQEAKLQGADFRATQLQRAKLLIAEMQGVDLTMANLQGARLGWNSPPGRLDAVFPAELDKSTKLPDGSLWTPETDIRRFTDPAHPDFEPISAESVREYLESLM